MRILLAGDIHIGRLSSWIGSREGDARNTASSAWERVVRLAIEEQVGAVLLSGDVIDKDNSRAEAFGPISRGLRDLTRQGIRTVAVTGNHDCRSLRMLAKSIGQEGLSFTLLGENGWESALVEGGDGTRLRVVGWSFPDTHYQRDPLDTFPADVQPDVPTLGLVHGDLGASESRYAPLSLGRLQAAPVSGWLLGHIHLPGIRASDGGPWVLYPGSPQALDPHESGVHGVWLAEVGETSMTVPVQRPLSTVRYETVAIDVSQAESVDDLRTTLLSGIRRAGETAADTGGEVLAGLVVDLVISGTTNAAASVHEVLSEFVDLEDFGCAIDIALRPASVAVATPLPLEELAAGTSMVAILARLVRDVEAGAISEDLDAVLQRVDRELRRYDAQATTMEGDLSVRLAPTDDEIRRRICIAGRRLLRQLTDTSRDVTTPEVS